MRSPKVLSDRVKASFCSQSVRPRERESEQSSTRRTGQEVQRSKLPSQIHSLSPSFLNRSVQQR